MLRCSALPFIFAGSQLNLNFSTSAAGSLQVEIQQQDGSPIPGFTMQDCLPVIGDKIDGAVRWKNDPDLAGLAGQPVRLKFELLECDLYSFQFDR